MSRIMCLPPTTKGQLSFPIRLLGSLRLSEIWPGCTAWTHVIKLMWLDSHTVALRFASLDRLVSACPALSHHEEKTVKIHQTKHKGKMMENVQEEPWIMAGITRGPTTK